MLIETLIEISIAIVIFVIGIYIVRWYARVKKREDSFNKALIINIPWLIINLSLGLIFVFTIINNLVIDILIVAINLIVGIVSVKLVYKIDFKDSFLFTIVIQIILLTLVFVLDIIISFVQKLVEALQVTGGLYNTQVLLVFIALLAIIGVTIFFGYWGDKVQLLKHKQLIVLMSLIPGIYLLLFFFVNFIKDFYTNIVIELIFSLLTSLVILGILRQIAFKNVPLQEIRALTVLEKDTTILQLKDLKVYYPLLKGMLRKQIGAVKAVDGISFEIKTNETVGLVGESGCGKTTVANAILGLIEKTSGEILYRGEPIPGDYSKYLRRKIQIVFQDPDASLNPRLKVVDIIAEPLISLLGITKKNEIRKRVLELLELVSLKREHLDRYPHEFSGGQKQRIIIARALASNPDLLILDEPTSALDVSVQAQILNLFKDLQKSYGYGFLFITHNLSVVNHIADRVAVMYLGKFVELGNTDQIFLNPTHPYTQALLASRSEIDPYNREISFVIEGEVPSPIAPPPGCTFNPRCVSDARTKECELELPHKIKIGENHFIWCVNPPTSKN